MIFVFTEECDSFLESLQVIELTEEIQHRKEPSVDAGIWLLVVTFMQIYNVKEKGKNTKCTIKRRKGRKGQKKVKWSLV